MRDLKRPLAGVILNLSELNTADATKEKNKKSKDFGNPAAMKSIDSIYR